MTSTRYTQRIIIEKDLILPIHVSAVELNPLSAHCGKLSELYSFEGTFSDFFQLCESRKQTYPDATFSRFLIGNVWTFSIVCNDYLSMTIEIDVYNREFLNHNRLSMADINALGQMSLDSLRGMKLDFSDFQ